MVLVNARGKRVKAKAREDIRVTGKKARWMVKGSLVGTMAENTQENT